ncbi:MAG TPA: sn-glycerol-1-phosphate dehydrogenase [Firmicutes bacterium]|nr:sn-glycerol-1-phosphate dehydrogenase [Bacillota bacterium]
MTSIIPVQKLQEILTQPAEECLCGRRHPVSLRAAAVGADACERMIDYVDRRRQRNFILVADENTYEAYGREVAAAMGGRLARKLVYPVPLVPDERAVETLMQQAAGCAHLIAVGSGTIHDLTRYVAHRMQVPFIGMPTAPSVDGFASSVSPLIINGAKKTIPTVMPEAIFADTKVLAAAPAEMIAAGYGDIIGKYTALADWRLAHVLLGEWYCPAIVELVRETVSTIVARRAALANREPEACAELLAALLLTGLAIEMAGDSRPASGSEHHLAHYWEMRSLWSREKVRLHGAEVGVATPLSAGLHHRLLAMPEVEVTALIERRRQTLGSGAQHGGERNAGRIRKYLGPLAAQFLEENRPLRPDAAAVDRRLSRLAASFAGLRKEAAATLPEPTGLRQLLREGGAPDTPAALGLPPEWVSAGLQVAMEIRLGRYTILQLLDELDVLEELTALVAGAAG